MPRFAPERRDESYVAGQTALLLVDMQKIWLDPVHGHQAETGQGKAYLYQRAADIAVPNAARLLKAARASGVEVVHTIIRSLTSDGRDRSPDHRLSGIHVAPDDPLAMPVDDLMPRSDEILLPKTSSGVFNSTNIDYVLRNLDVRYLVVAGVMTDQCIDMAVRDGADRGYMVTCVADACAAGSQERHDQALRAFGGYCWVTDTDTVVNRFESISR
jgi:nicotinamidase-related amidase